MNPLNSTEKKVKPVILAVSFGTSFDDSREKTIGAIEGALAQAYPEWEVRRAFTSGMILRSLRKRGVLIDSVGEAMERLVLDGVQQVVVQPTHVMQGFEYDEAVDEVESYRDRIGMLHLAQPLLSEEADYEKLIRCLAEDLAPYEAEKTAIVLMGHGTEHPANSTYSFLRQKLEAAGRADVFVGTVEAEPTVQDVLTQVQKTDAKRVVLLPLMVVAGDHANNDMAGEDPDSWKSIFEAAGYEVTCVLRGMGESSGVQQIYVEHTAAAMVQ